MCIKLYNIFSFLFWYVGLNLCKVMLEATCITKITWAHVRQNWRKLDSGNAWAKGRCSQCKNWQIYLKLFFLWYLMGTCMILAKYHEKKMKNNVGGFSKMICLHVGVLFSEMPCEFIYFVCMCPHNTMYTGREVFMLLN